MAPEINGRTQTYVNTPRFGDYNGDGIEDVVDVADRALATSRPHLMCFILFTASATFADVMAREACLPAFINNNSLMGPDSVVDVTNDGKLDLTFRVSNGSGNLTVSRLGVVFGDGTGGFTAVASSLPSGISGTEGFFRGDVLDANADGKVDLVLSNMIPNMASATRLVFGDGAGNFSFFAP
jgi:hypothetical protein